MATTIEQAASPLLLTYSFLGIGVCFPKRLYLSVIYNLTVWISYGYLYDYSVAALKAGRWFQTVINIVQVRIGILATITSSITGVYQHKRFRIFMKRLAAVDDTLEELGTPKLYQKLHICTKRVIAGWMAYSIAGNIFDMIWWLYATGNRWCMILPYIINYYHHTNIFVDVLFTTFLWYIGTKFDNVNEHMRYLLVKEEHGLRCTRTNTVTTIHIKSADYYKRVLWISMHVHLELCQIARELNTMFGLHITIETIANLVYLTRLCYYILKHMRTKIYFMLSLDSWLSIYFWISIHVARLFCLNCVCENVSAKANEVKGIIHQLSNTLPYTDVRDEIYQFTLTIIRHPLKFTGLGLFYFGNSFLRKFFITITSFLIFIMQMSD